MRMTEEDVRRHPAYKHGFEGHRRFLESGQDRSEGYHARYGLICPLEYASSAQLSTESHGISLNSIWMSGAHAGMKNSNSRWSLGGPNNPEPIYGFEVIQIQLDLFD